MKLNLKSRQGHFVGSIDGKPIFRIGKYKGRSVIEVYEEDEDYLEWVYDTTESAFDREVIENDCSDFL